MVSIVEKNAQTLRRGWGWFYDSLSGKNNNFTIKINCINLHKTLSRGLENKWTQPQYYNHKLLLMTKHFMSDGVIPEKAT